MTAPESLNQATPAEAFEMGRAIMKEEIVETLEVSQAPKGLIKRIKKFHLVEKQGKSTILELKLLISIMANALTRRDYKKSSETLDKMKEALR